MIARRKADDAVAIIAYVEDILQPADSAHEDAQAQTDEKTENDLSAGEKMTKKRTESSDGDGEQDQDQETKEPLSKSSPKRRRSSRKSSGSSADQ